MSRLNIDDAHAMAQYWLAPHQYLESTLFGLFFGILFILGNRLTQYWRIERFGFGKSILINSGIYLVGFVLIIYLVYLILDGFGIYARIEIGTFLGGLDTVELVVAVMGIMVMQILFINFVLQSIAIMGDHNLVRFVTGKYRQPVVEDRAFMFLDLRDSTRHGEQLGYALYSEMIRDCFRDLNYLLNRYEAEIYQYVGDEIVLTWPTELARQDFRIFGIFFAFRAQLAKKSDHYRSKYGVVPEFKAGCNSGKVTAAEIGIIKKDIAFHGDVLNTASRAQGLCNKLGEDLLITAKLGKQLPMNNTYDIRSVGEHNLKGKEGMTELFAVRKQGLIG